VHPTDRSVVYAGALNGAVYQTTDGGADWHQSGGAFAKDVRALAISPTSPGIILAGTERDGLFISTDAGRTWAAAGAGLDPNASIHSIVIDPSAPGVFWVADFHTGIYRSMDGGKTWVGISRGLSTRAVNALAISSDGQVLYAATQGEGVFRLEVKAPPQAPAASR
jgi:photosystem II stability/assembly factor-like uncharacterized protein